MKVFISWSGPMSRVVAEMLRDLLPVIIQRAEPWLSSEDIEKGARWHAELAAQLQDTQVGILCLTPENLTSPWLLFEAGALSKSLAEGRVCPYLIGVEPADIAGPLAQFQSARADRDDTLRLLGTVNAALPPSEALEEVRLIRAFDLAWPEMRQGIAVATASRSAAGVLPRRKDRDLLEELLALARAQSRDLVTVRSALSLPESAASESPAAPPLFRRHDLEALPDGMP